MVRRTILCLSTLLVALACGESSRRTAQAEHPALVLVAEYAARDAQGEFTGVSEWYDGATDFDANVPGWDQGAVIARYSVSPLHLDDDSAVITVTYDRVAVISGDGAGGTHLSFGDTTYTEQFVVRRTPEGWRIIEPILPSHTSALVVAQYPSLTDGQRTQLRMVARLDPP